CVQATHWPHSF
nr:immunoglobulin light chain junction region [Macaca mulatta]